jgi:glyoxylase-like metal-dependent hydrolase (beta-lactamase superfamily II)
MGTHHLCSTCGTQFAEAAAPPDRCPICEDERQYVNWKGQQWTSLEALRQGHRNVLRDEEPGVTSIVTEPSFAIGQRALLLQAPSGNILWDCLSLIDEPTVNAVQALGGLSAIAISHPHYYSSMVEWSRAFDSIPIYLHSADREWIMRPDPSIRRWETETHRLGDGVTLIRCGGHFSGAAVLHWGAGAGGKGVLFTGDTIQVVLDRGHVSFMRSYPNLIPLSAAAVRRIVDAVQPYAFDRIYGAFAGRTIAHDAKAGLARSADRYVTALDG